MSGISPKSEGSSRFHMVDVGEKTPTRRRAIASGRIHVGEEAFSRIRNGTMPKGDLLALAEVAGVQSAKRASEFIPLCHPLALDQVLVRFELESEKASVRVTCEASAVAKTGVEMEALAGVQSALLAIYDLTKGVNPALWISDIHLEVKEGGKSGLWKHPGGPSRNVSPDLSTSPKSPKKDDGKSPFDGLLASVLVSSDRASRGETEDVSGPTAQRLLEQRGARVRGNQVFPDDREKLAQAIAENSTGPNAVDLLVISGGTGLGPRDITPEALELAARNTAGRLSFRKVPGIGELLRAGGAQFTPMAWLSRSEGAFLGKTFVILLPGSPKAVEQGISQLEKLIPHVIQMSRGGGHG